MIAIFRGSEDYAKSFFICSIGCPYIFIIGVFRGFEKIRSVFFAFVEF